MYYTARLNLEQPLQLREFTKRYLSQAKDVKLISVESAAFVALNATSSIELLSQQLPTEADRKNYQEQYEELQANNIEPHGASSGFGSHGFGMRNRGFGASNHGFGRNGFDGHDFGTGSHGFGRNGFDGHDFGTGSHGFGRHGFSASSQFNLGGHSLGFGTGRQGFQDTGIDAMQQQQKRKQEQIAAYIELERQLMVQCKNTNRITSTNKLEIAPTVETEASESRRATGIRITMNSAERNVFALII